MQKTDWKLLTRSAIENEATRNEWLMMARDEGAIALIDKEENWTSFDCVAKLRNLVRAKRVGHAGTLDPLATGLLVVCFGRATKDVEKIQEEEKTYLVTTKLGFTTSTDDRGSLEESGEWRVVIGELTEEDIRNTLLGFVGTLQQTPPAFSAVRHGGKRQYDLARQGKEFVNKPRIVTIHSIENIVVHFPFVDFSMRCSKGTYVRSVARDLGQKLGCGGYVWSLRRTEIGSFDVADAVTIGECKEMFGVKEAA